MSNAMQRCTAKNLLQDPRGSTLLELLIALSIWALLLPVLAGGLFFTVKSYTSACERLEAREQAVAVLRKVESEVRAGHNFKLQTGGMSFQDSQNRSIQYLLTRTGSLQRIEEGVSSMVIGAKIATMRWSLDATGVLIRLELSIQVGHTRFDMEELLAGRGELP